MADVSYSIDISVADSAAAAAAAKVEALSAALETATSAADAARARYNELQVTADKAAKALERSAAKGLEGSESHAALAAASDAARAALAAQAGVLGELESAESAAEAAVKSATRAQEEQAAAAKISEDRGKKQTAAMKANEKEMKLLAAGALVAAAALVTLAVGFAHVVFGAIKLADKNKRLDAASAKLKKNFADIFGGLKIDKVLDGLDTLVALFDKNTASGKAIKFLFETMFQPIIDGIAAAIPYIERFALLAVLYALKAYNALKPYSAEIKLVAQVLGVVAAVIAGVVVASIALFVGFIAAGIAIVVGIVAVLGLLVNWLIGAVPAAFNAVVGAASGAWSAVVGAVQAAWDWLSSLSLSDIGSALIDGLVSGIVSAGGAVLSAITGVVGGAIDAAKAALGIHSPSTLMQKEIGEPMGEGAAVGVDKTTGRMQSALESLTAPPDLAKGGVGGKAGGAISGNTFNFYGVKDAEAGRDMYEDALTKILEGDALSAAS